MSRIKYKFSCQSCGHSWFSSSLKTSCPRCRQKNIRYLKASVGGYRLGCRECNIFWYDEVAPAPCINCNQQSTNVLPIYVGEGERLNFPLRVPIKPEPAPRSSSAPVFLPPGSSQSRKYQPSPRQVPHPSPPPQTRTEITLEQKQLIFRLGCRNCDIYWFYMKRDGPCPQCEQKSTSSKDEYVDQAKIDQIQFARPYKMDDLPDLYSKETVLCPSCGLQMEETPNFCPACGKKLVESAPTPWRSIFCLQCGTEVQKGSKEFCPVCGNPLKF
ncbi:MAG: zinc ribbon domain-containing protein [Candidatus Hodarchaeota archaeon]